MDREDIIMDRCEKFKDAELKSKSDMLTLISIIPFLDIILFLITIILLPFNLKKYLKFKKYKDENFW